MLRNYAAQWEYAGESKESSFIGRAQLYVKSQPYIFQVCNEEIQECKPPQGKGKGRLKMSFEKKGITGMDAIMTALSATDKLEQMLEEQNATSFHVG